MRNAWKSLFPWISSQLPRSSPQRVQVSALERQNPRFVYSLSVGNAERRYFSSETATERRGSDHALVAEIFSKPIGFTEIQAELESCNVSLDQETAFSVLQNLEGQPETARRFFDWVSERESKILRSKSYNLMLRILGSKRDTGEFWDLFEIMKNKGFGISKETYLKVSGSLINDGKGNDFGTYLKEMYLQNSPQHVVARTCPKICRILQENEDPREIHTKLQDLDISLSSELIVAVLERISPIPKKARVFFDWIRDHQSFKIDGTVYNAIAKVMGREDCVQEFWDILHRMKNAGHRMEKDMYSTVLDRFLKRKMIVGAVDLYEFAMSGPGKPPACDFLHILKKVVVSKELDMALVSRVVSIFINSGNTVKESAFDGILKSLKSVGRLAECGNVLRAMEIGGFVANSAVHNQVVVGLCSAGRLGAACEYVKSLENHGHVPDLKAWTSLVQRHALAGELDKAASCFREMVEKKGSGHDGRAFEVLVNGLCKQNRDIDAFKILKEMVTKRNIRPQHSTYKFLIEKLVYKGSLKEATALLQLMRGQGFPPFVEPFIGYVSKSGSAADAMGFLKAMTDKEFPSRPVFLHLFRALLEAGRLDVAHDILYKSPGSVRNHVDVLDIFNSMRPNEIALSA